MKNEIFLCKPRGAIVASLAVDEETVSLTESISSPWELTFSLHRYKEMEEMPYYHSLSEMMELFLVSEFCTARFVIDEEPTISSDGIAETKAVTAHSIEIELQYKNLENFQINTGKPESQENLVKGDLGGHPISATDTTKEIYDYNLNPYTNLPVDYITVACNLGEELQVFKDDIDTSSNPYTLKWMFEGDDAPKTISFTFDDSTGKLLGSTITDEALLIKWYEDFIVRYPRIVSDIIWGYDARPDQKTLGSVVCVTDVYLYGVGSSIYIPAPSYEYTAHVGEDAVDINYSSSPATFDRFINGLQKLIDFYADFGSQLSLLDIVLEKAKGTGWGVGDVPEEVRKRKSINFNVDNQDIYSFLMNTASHALKVIFDFDRVRKRLNVIDLSLDDTVFETGIVTGFNNLLQSVDISTGTTDGIKTVFKPKGGNDLDITYVNFGREKIVNLDYFINKVDKADDYQYGTAELHDKYREYLDFRDSDQVSLQDVPQPLMTVDVNGVVEKSFININTKTLAVSTETLTGTRRELYVELSKRYNRVLKDISELTYLVPSDGAKTDYTSYSLKDLQVVYKAYANALEALKQCWKTFYSGENIEDTPLYADYVLYTETIIPNVLNALKMFALTDKNGNFLKEDGHTPALVFDDFYYPKGGNPQYNGDAKLVTEGKEETFLYDMSLQGLSELNVNKTSWLGAAAKLYKEAFVKSGTPGDPYDPAVYRTWDMVKAEGLDGGFKDQATYERQLYNYLDYMAITDNWYTESHPENSLTKDQTKGVVVLAVKEIKKCESIIEALETIQKTVDVLRQDLADSVTYEGWGGFSDEEIAILYSLQHEADYSNENILTTNLDDVVTTIDVQEELYQDAQKRLFDKSRPQYSIKTTLDNILAIKEFEPLRDQLKLLNYFYLRYGLYDDETMKLRIVQMQFNPIIKSQEFALEFSNMTYTYEGLNDLYYLFEDNMGGSSGSTSSSSSGGSSGTYGENDAQITLSNNMLNALLRNNTTSQSLKIDNLLDIKTMENLMVNGDVIIDGAAITDVIKSKNYNKEKTGGVYPIDNTEGSILRLNDGSFNFGGGKLIFNSTNSSLTMNGGKIKTSDNKNVIDFDAGTVKLGNGNFNLDATGSLTVKGKIETTSGYIGGFTIAQEELWAVNSEGSTSGISLSSKGRLLIIKDQIDAPAITIQQVNKDILNLSGGTQMTGSDIRLGLTGSLSDSNVVELTRFGLRIYTNVSDRLRYRLQLEEDSIKHQTYNYETELWDTDTIIWG